MSSTFFLAFYPAVPRRPCIAMGCNERGFAEALDEVSNLLLRQNTIECGNKVTHGGLATVSNHVKDCLDITNVIFLSNGLYMGHI